MEIERKFLPKIIPFNTSDFKYLYIQQAYISTNPTIRIRKSENRYFLTIKGSGKLARQEYELLITKEQYATLKKKVETSFIIKKRYLYPLENNLTAEIDIYESNLKGLVTIEVEFETIEQAKTFIPPTWFGKDISMDKRYKNTSLSQNGIPK